METFTEAVVLSLCTASPSSHNFISTSLILHRHPLGWQRSLNHQDMHSTKPLRVSSVWHQQVSRRSFESYEFWVLFVQHIPQIHNWIEMCGTWKLIVDCSSNHSWTIIEVCGRVRFPIDRGQYQYAFPWYGCTCGCLGRWSASKYHPHKSQHSRISSRILRNHLFWFALLPKMHCLCFYQRMGSTVALRSISSYPTPYAVCCEGPVVFTSYSSCIVSKLRNSSSSLRIQASLPSSEPWAPMTLSPVH